MKVEKKEMDEVTKEEKKMEDEEKEKNVMDKNQDYLELGAQWIHGRGANPLWQFCRLHGLPFQEARIHSN